MKCEILASVMNQKNKKEILKQLNISENDKCIVINQVTENIKPEKDDLKSNHKFISYKEKGLSRSRNHALENTTSEICILSDNDMEFVPNYQEIIKQSYKKYPKADIIVFKYNHINPKKSKKTMKKGKIDFLKSMKISSPQITFKNESIKNAKITFDENFGAGSGKYNWGEENIFLFDCLRSGLKIYYIPIATNTICDMESTWSKENSPEHYAQQGAIYYRMTPRFWRILAMQFIVRKRKIYGKDMRGLDVYKSMVKGAKAYKKERKNG